MSKIFNRSFSIPKDIIKEAIDNTDSMAQAAHYLGISYPTFKKYARVYKVWSPRDGSTGQYYKKYIRHKWTGYQRLGTTQERNLLDALVKELKVLPKCCRCGYNKYRSDNYQLPLMLHFKDGHAANRNPDNIELYCYNCWYMTAETRIKEVEHNKMLRNLNKKHYVPSASISAEASSSSDEIAADFGMALADLFAKSR